MRIFLAKNLRNPLTLTIILSLSGLMINLGCSLGALVVQVSTPTPTPFKTPKPTFTFTPNWTATFTPSLTPTPSHTPTPTETPIPASNDNAEGEVITDTTEIITDTTQATTEPPPTPEPLVDAPTEPPVPTNTPTPEEPTATPTPAYPFSIVPIPHNTGSPGETRMTAWVVKISDASAGRFNTLPGYRMRVVAPDGNTYFSEVSGDGFADSTVAGAGDNHRMNTKLEIRPYTAGTYQVSLVDGADVQVSPEVEVVFEAEPRQYIHFDFFNRTN